MHSLYTYLEENRGRSKPPERFHELSHGQGFLEILRTRVNQRGFYLMDEPDAPLSFISCLSLVALLHDLAGERSQLVVATHSPVVAAVPGARILELGDWGIREANWDDLEIVQSWRISSATRAASSATCSARRRRGGGGGGWRGDEMSRTRAWQSWARAGSPAGGGLGGQPGGAGGG